MIYGCAYPPYYWTSEIYAADVLVADDLDFSNDPSAWNRSLPTLYAPGHGRQVFIHEFGHFFGFGHDTSGVHTMMLPGDFGTFPTVAGTPSAVLWPSDVEGLEDYYGLNSSLPNLVASVQEIDTAPANVKLLNSNIAFGCPGDTRTYEFYIGNTGKSSTGTFGGRVFLNKSISSSAGVTVHTFTKSLAAFSHDPTYEVSFTVPDPSSSPYLQDGQIHYVNIYLDHAGSLSETSNLDNWTRSTLIDTSHPLCQ